MAKRPTFLGCLSLLLAISPVLADTPYRVYAHTQSRAALRIAQRECKPLVLHFVPDEKTGADQIKTYYGPNSPIPRADLDRVIVVVIPKDRYRAFAESMGIHEAGGLRTVSPYELAFTDRGGLMTIRDKLEIRSGPGSSDISAAGFENDRLWSVSPAKPNTRLVARVVSWCGQRLIVKEVCMVDRIVRRRTELPAERAREYFREAGRRFEDYAAERYPRVLTEPRAGDLALLAAVSYVATRAVPGYQSQLQEIFTTRRAGPLADTIHEACLDALIATTDDRAVTARFLAYVGSQPSPPPGRQLCIEGLQRLQPEATEELFDYLGRNSDGPHRRRLASLIQRVTRTPSPQPLRFWQEANNEEAIQATIEAWRREMVEPHEMCPARRFSTRGATSHFDGHAMFNCGCPSTRQRSARRRRQLHQPLQFFTIAITNTVPCPRCRSAAVGTSLKHGLRREPG